jgi:hypothetical protein
MIHIVALTCDSATMRAIVPAKPQAQCRATIEALAEIKNPRPVAFVKQANIAQGPQQVNNRIESGADPRGS